LLHNPVVNNTQSEVLMALRIKTMVFWNSLIDVGSLRVNLYLPEDGSTRLEHNGSIYQ
jgi:hypothetical protein